MRVASAPMFVAVGLFCGFGLQVRADYLDEVLEDEPVAYWRLGEDDPLLPAENMGTELTLADGVYTGGV